MRMKRLISLFFLISLALAICLLAAAQPRSAQALPEYSAQTGEPCATCHLSPSGGGPRGPRGQAWVGAGKPGTVSDLAQALEQLGIHLEVDESLYQAPVGPAAPARPLEIQPNSLRPFYDRLSAYDGN